MYSSYYSKNLLSSSNSLASASVWIIVSIILAIIGGILIYFLFLSKKNEGKFNGFVVKENSMVLLDGFMISYHLRKCLWKHY